MTLKLYWQDILRECAGGESTPMLGLHAALVAFSGRYGTEVHTHDFVEIMYVTGGQGIHNINCSTHKLSEGDLWFIRPQDNHAVRGTPGSRLVFINVAFPMEEWMLFGQAAGISSQVEEWAGAATAPTYVVREIQRERASEIFHRALQDFRRQGSRLQACRFWGDVATLVTESEGLEAGDNSPLWLMRACSMMRDPENLRIGLPRMLALSGVSSGHLSRALKHHKGQTPTEFITELRLDRAAMLLATTTGGILDICLECGIENLSYFYRRFRQRFGTTPAIHRKRIGLPIAPN